MVCMHPLYVHQLNVLGLLAFFYDYINGGLFSFGNQMRHQSIKSSVSVSESDGKKKKKKKKVSVSVHLLRSWVCIKSV